MPAVVTSLVNTKRQPLLGATLRLWHLLSLDAPTVAGVWACLLARVSGAWPSGSAVLVLVLGTWLIYIADRLLDGRRGSSPLLLRERHYFVMRHWSRFLSAGLAVVTVMAWLVVTRMSARARSEDGLIFLAAMVYFVFVHGDATHGLLPNRWFPKEVAVAILFSMATAVPAWSQLPNMGAPLATHQWLLALGTLIFSAGCWLNCIAIEHWETTGSSQAATQATLTQWAGRHLSLVCAVFAGFTLAAAPVSLWSGVLRTLVPVLLSTAASALIFLILEQLRFLDQRRFHLSLMRLRIAADLALLTPLLLLPLLR